MLWKSLDPDRDPKLLPSALIGKPFPGASLPQLELPETLDTTSLIGKPFVVNVFASWCPECVSENPVLIDFNRRSEVPLIGIAYKDERSDTREWLQRWGNPFDRVLVDADGRFGINLGVYGAPETYFVDNKGMVRRRHVGALSAAELSDFVDELQR
jgi:cytochrome c biogenesis protein CcmG/thiol:disulfide interchange protein DsbE